jgi:hypothetical protein
MNRKDFIQGLAAAGGALVAGASLAQVAVTRGSEQKRPRAIAMWDFSWLERRWPGAGYEDWDQALDELVERGYDAVRIDAYPHLVAADPGKSWLLKPKWDTQDWGSPTLVRVRVQPELQRFVAKCADRHIKVGLSTWLRQDEDEVCLTIASPEKLAEIWNATLATLRQAGLLDTILYVDLWNEWPEATWAASQDPPIEQGQWSDSRSMRWMRTAIAGVRAAFPELPLLFSTDNDRVEAFAEQDLSFFDAIEHHLWMAGENNDEFYGRTGYNYERFSQAGYHNLQLTAAAVYAAQPEYWQKLLTDKIARLAAAARRARLPVMTTECWGIIDYKDWPLLPWDWVKELCALGTRRAAGTGQWAVVATSNFCGPQFRGMWRDVTWHQQLTQEIRNAPMDAALRASRLWARL